MLDMDVDTINAILLLAGCLAMGRSIIKDEKD